MSAIHVDLAIRNLADPSRCRRAPFLVDTGVSACVIRLQRLEANGIAPGGQCAYELADGRQARIDVAVAQLDFMREFVGGTVVFGEAGTEPLLGVTASESMGVEVNHRNQELRNLSSVRSKKLCTSRRLDNR